MKLAQLYETAGVRLALRDALRSRAVGQNPAMSRAAVSRAITASVGVEITNSDTLDEIIAGFKSRNAVTDDMDLGGMALTAAGADLTQDPVMILHAFERKVMNATRNTMNALLGVCEADPKMLNRLSKMLDENAGSDDSVSWLRNGMRPLHKEIIKRVLSAVKSGEGDKAFDDNKSGSSSGDSSKPRPDSDADSGKGRSEASYVSAGRVPNNMYDVTNALHAILPKGSKISTSGDDAEIVIDGKTHNLRYNDKTGVLSLDSAPSEGFMVHSSKAQCAQTAKDLLSAMTDGASGPRVRVLKASVGTSVEASVLSHGPGKSGTSESDQKAMATLIQVVKGKLPPALFTASAEALDVRMVIGAAPSVRVVSFNGNYEAHGLDAKGKVAGQLLKAKTVDGILPAILPKKRSVSAMPILNLVTAASVKLKWIEKDSPKRWLSGTPEISFTVKEIPGPGMSLYTLTALLADGTALKHSKPAQWKEKADAFKVASAWAKNAVNSNAIGLDYSREWSKI